MNLIFDVVLPLSGVILAIIGFGLACHARGLRESLYR
jgi:hypothetical protein